MILSVVKTALQQVNHNMDAPMRTAEARPKQTASQVTGLPLGKAKRTVTPSWLNSGFSTAVKSSTGMRNPNCRRKLFAPSRYQR